MSIANGLALPNPLSNGTTADAVQVMGDFNYLLAVVNRALLDAGGGSGMNAQSTQIHNLANGTASNDAVNLSQLGGYALLSGAAFTGAVSFAAAVTMASLAVSSNVTIGGTLSVTGLDTLGSGLNLTGPLNVTSGGMGLKTAGQLMFFTDQNGGTPFLAIDGSNNLVCAGTDGSGSQRTLWFAGMHSGTSALQISVPLQVNQNLACAQPLNLTGALTTGSAANSIGYLGIPSVTKTTGYTLAVADVGTAINMNGASLTLTIPANASVAIPVDSVILITNLNSSALSIAITSDTLTMSGTTSTGTRTLGQNGEARLRKVSATSWLIAGTNLS